MVHADNAYKVYRREKKLCSKLRIWKGSWIDNTVAHRKYLKWKSQLAIGALIKIIMLGVLKHNRWLYNSWRGSIGNKYSNYRDRFKIKRKLYVIYRDNWLNLSKEKPLINKNSQILKLNYKKPASIQAMPTMRRSSNSLIWYWIRMQWIL